MLHILDLFKTSLHILALTQWSQSVVLVVVVVVCVDFVPRGHLATSGDILS